MYSNQHAIIFYCNLNIPECSLKEFNTYSDLVAATLDQRKHLLDCYKNSSFPFLLFEISFLLIEKRVYGCPLQQDEVSGRFLLHPDQHHPHLCVLGDFYQLKKIIVGSMKSTFTLTKIKIVVLSELYQDTQNIQIRQRIKSRSIFYSMECNLHMKCNFCTCYWLAHLSIATSLNSC